MESAGAQVAQMAERCLAGLPSPKVMVLCGPGNNGGDGFVIARHLDTAGCHVQVFCTQAFDQYKGDAASQLKALRNCDMEPVVVDQALVEQLPTDVEFIVDALLGTGSKGEIRPLFASLFRWVNAQKAKVLSVDLPSGLNPDLAEEPPLAIRADVTASLGALKPCTLFPPALDWVGAVQHISLGFPKSKLFSVPHRLLEYSDAWPWWPRRKSHGYKGDAGKLLIWAGSRDMLGAAVLCAQAAIKSGCGMVQLALPQDLCASVSSAHPEIMTLALPTKSADGHLDVAGACSILVQRLAWADAMVIGPGLGVGADIQQLFSHFLPQCEIPTLLDADAINLLAQWPEGLELKHRPYLLTPHKGEWTRCFGPSPQMGLPHLDHCRQVAEDQGWSIHFKGAPSCTGLPNGTVWVNATGNELLSVAGSGDVLSGMAGALMAMGLNTSMAGLLAGLVHGRVADVCFAEGRRHGFSARDLLEAIPKVLDAGLS